MAENRNEDWKKDPKLEDIDAAKLDMLQKLAEKGSGKSASADCRQSPGIAGIFYCIHRFSGIMILSERRCFL